MKDCVSLEVAQKLQKAGYKQSEGYYYEPPFPFVIKSDTPDSNYIPAPTATQLAEETVKKVRSSVDYVIAKGWRVTLLDFRKDPEFIADTLPDALGLMMEYLLTNKLI